MKIHVFLKISALKILVNFSGKYVRWETPALPSGLQPATLLNSDANTSVFL